MGSGKRLVINWRGQTESHMTNLESFASRANARLLLGCHVSNSMQLSIVYIDLICVRFLFAKTANAHVINRRAIKPEVT